MILLYPQTQIFIFNLNPCFRVADVKYWVGIGWTGHLGWRRYDHSCSALDDDVTSGLWSFGHTPDGETAGHCVYVMNGALYAAHCDHSYKVLCASLKGEVLRHLFIFNL